MAADLCSITARAYALRQELPKQAASQQLQLQVYHHSLQLLRLLLLLWLKVLRVRTNRLQHAALGRACVRLPATSTANYFVRQIIVHWGHTEQGALPESISIACMGSEVWLLQGSSRDAA